MTEIKLKITSCQECPFWERKRMWTEDSFEEAYDWFCKKKKTKDGNKKIAGYVEWNDVDKIKVPEWCPIKVK